jgi:hypothetical protein
MKTKIINLKNRYVSAIQGNLDLSISEENIKSENINISLKNGYWQINEKPIKKCSIVKQRFFDEYIRMKLIKLEILDKSSFKNRSQEVKSQFNHVFRLPNEEKRFFNNDYTEIVFVAKN